MVRWMISKVLTFLPTLTLTILRRKRINQHAQVVPCGQPLTLKFDRMLASYPCARPRIALGCERSMVTTILRPRTVHEGLSSVVYRSIDQYQCSGPTSPVFEPPRVRMTPQCHVINSGVRRFDKGLGYLLKQKSEPAAGERNRSVHWKIGVYIASTYRAAPSPVPVLLPSRYLLPLSYTPRYKPLPKAVHAPLSAPPLNKPFTPSVLNISLPTATPPARPPLAACCAFSISAFASLPSASSCLMIRFCSSPLG